MMEFGKTLRTARETKGYTVAQLAEMTHLAPSVVTKLEQENFCTLPAPIYGRGFVKLYCEAVGLEPKPLVDAFMEIFDSRKATPPAPPAPPPSAKPAPGVAPALDFESPKETAPEPTRTESAEPPPQPNLFDQPAPADRTQPPLSRYATPFRDMGHGISASWRIALLAAAAVSVLVLLIWGLCALRRTTAPSALPEPEPAPTEALSTAPDSPKPPPAATREKRTQQEIPSLYIY